MSNPHDMSTKSTAARLAAAQVKAEALTEALPECRVVMVTTFGRPGYLQRAMAAGAVRPEARKLASGRKETRALVSGPGSCPAIRTRPS